MIWCHDLSGYMMIIRGLIEILLLKCLILNIVTCFNQQSGLISCIIGGLTDSVKSDPTSLNRLHSPLFHKQTRVHDMWFIFSWFVISTTKVVYKLCLKCCCIFKKVISSKEILKFQNIYYIRWRTSSDYLYYCFSIIFLILYCIG